MFGSKNFLKVLQFHKSYHVEIAHLFSLLSMDICLGALGLLIQVNQIGQGGYSDIQSIRL